MRGGALASAVEAYASHGCPQVRRTINDLVESLSEPVWSAACGWVLDGELTDPFGEFFITSNESIPNSRSECVCLLWICLIHFISLWRDKYKLRESMLPSFVGIDLAQRVLLAGKAINFIRNCCGDQEVSGCV